MTAKANERMCCSISLITILSLIGENCRKCREAAEADDGHGGGLAGRWWRAWATASDASGYIGAGIVGGFAVVVAGWYGGRWLVRSYARKPLDERRNGGGVEGHDV